MQGKHMTLAEARENWILLIVMPKMARERKGMLLKLLGNIWMLVSTLGSMIVIR
jgi:hypothetical protein